MRKYETERDELVEWGKGGGGGWKRNVNAELDCIRKMSASKSATRTTIAAGKCGTEKDTPRRTKRVRCTPTRIPSRPRGTGFIIFSL